MPKITLNPFEIEALRAELAKEHKYKSLKNTYTDTNHEIPDQNTCEMWDEINGEFSGNPMVFDRVEIVADQIPNHSVRVLNIGFGSANLEKEYFRRFNQDISWYGIDISEKSVKAAQNKYKDAQFSVGTILNLDFNDNYFDYVTVLEVMEHISPKNTFKALGEIFRVLASRGTVVVSVPLNEGLEEMVSRGENPNAHVRVYSPELIKAEIEIAGFEIVKNKVLYAFGAYYKLKSFLVTYILHNFRHPNNIIIIARKP